MKSKIEINISVIDDGPVVMRCQDQNTSKGKALDALEDAYLSTVAQLMRKDPPRPSRRKPPRNLARRCRTGCWPWCEEKANGIWSAAKKR